MAKVIVVSFEPTAALAGFAGPFPSEFLFVSDPNRELYSLYGPEVGSWRDILAPQTLWFYLRAALRGEYRPSQRGVDKRQLGGDFVIDASGRVALAHASSSPTDRVAIEEVERVVQALGVEKPGLTE